MGRREREALATELAKLGTHTEENQAYYDQNRRVAEAEKNVNIVENLWVRANND